jgi:Cu2+-exporting ATPase
MSAADAVHARWSLDSGEHEHVVFLVEGMHCAGCARSIEKAVRALPDVMNVRVNNATARVTVDWLGHSATGLTQILGAVVGAGFKPVPLAGTVATAEYQRERRTALKRVGLASLGMMQAMMYLSALYGVTDIDASMAQLMRIAGMVIVTPVLFYSGAPFLAGAWRDLKHRRLGMDVPVALALVLAWLPSVVNTLRADGEVYFDSVGMFIFFLSAGRFVEMSVRHRSLTSSEALARSLPAQVTRLLADGNHERIEAYALAVGDRFLVPKGGVVAVDAALPAELPPEVQASLDESLITGESAAVRRGAGERIRGGSVNLGSPLTLTATATVEDSTLASMVQLLDRAQGTRPKIALAADRAASWFVGVILVLAVITAVAWWPIDPARAFAAVLAVLVVTCPCALSLATPVALAAATTRLARLGVLVTRADAIERLARADTVIFDKTGTLTGTATGVLGVRLASNPRVSISQERALAMAAALERGSAHPLAEGFRPHENVILRADALSEFEAQGVEGRIDGIQWRLGRREFAAALAPHADATGQESRDAATRLYLGSEQGLVAEFELGVPLRADAGAAIEQLRSMGLSVIIASGDSGAAVTSAAHSLGITCAYSRLTPDDKIRLLQDLRGNGHRVFVIGDGINDGPVLAASDVSCAMGQGSAIAQSASDLLLVHEGLAMLPRAVATARRALRVMRQNLAWALAYNLAAVPLAALGFVSPWLAALGMSLSSLGVVLNARRLATSEKTP